MFEQSNVARIYQSPNGNRLVELYKKAADSVDIFEVKSNGIRKKFHTISLYSGEIEALAIALMTPLPNHDESIIRMGAETAVLIIGAVAAFKAGDIAGGAALAEKAAAKFIVMDRSVKEAIKNKQTIDTATEGGHGG